MNRNVNPKVRKSLIRNCDVLTHKVNVQVHEIPKLSNKNDENRVFIKMSEDILPKYEPNKYNKPELYTTLGVSKKIDDIKKMKVKKIKNISELTPKSKEFATEEVTKKLNFPIDKIIFKGLIPLNVNDSIRETKQFIPIKKKYVQRKSQNKEPTPDLNDFTNEIEPFEIKQAKLKNQIVLYKPNLNNFSNIYRIHECFGSEF